MHECVRKEETMKKSALRKDFIREILKSKNRFISILFIVALGVAFFSGIRAAEPDMRYSYDEYFDEHDLFDIRIMGSYGITEDDINNLKSLEKTKDAEGGYFSDLFTNVDGSWDIIRVEGIMDKFNTCKLESGRMPENEKEIVLDVDYAQKMGCKIGEDITFKAPEDSDIEDILSNATFEIVGFVSSPMYISFTRGSTNIGSGSIDAFAFVSKEAFTLEAYTNADISLKNAKAMTAFTDTYDNYIEDAVAYIEDNISDSRCEIRYDEIIAKSNDKINDAQKELDDAKKEADEKLDDAQKELDNAKEELEDGKNKLNDAKKQISDAKKELADNEKLLSEKEEEYNQGVLNLKNGESQYAAGLDEYLKGSKELEKAKQQTDEGFAKLNEGEVQYKQAIEQLNELYDKQSRLNEAISQYQMLNLPVPQEIMAQAATVDMAINTILQQTEGVDKELEKSRIQLSNANEEIAKNDAKLNEAQRQLKEAREQLAEGSMKLSEGKEQLDEGKRQLKEAKEKIAEHEKELEDAQKELEDGQKKYDDAYAEYEEKKSDAQKELNDAQKELDDAKKDIADLEKPKWYVKDRSTLNAYAECGENADRIKAIGKVFPVLFFVVAALISLTTMTRMVEEQRTLIGTLKALGYSKWQIAKKYILYAFFATIMGSILGVLIGEKILPYIIIFSYQIMYLHIENIVIPYNVEYMLMSAVAAIVCVLGAAIMSCYKELRSYASELMRPVPPKNGKRIILERLPILWNNLNFTWKATFRNLIRYKKRFFMTVFGIGGCMALMVVGFGLRDSIMDIATIQYSQLQTYEANVMVDADATKAEKEELEKKLEEDKNIIAKTKVRMESVKTDTKKGEKTLYLVTPLNSEEINDFITFRNRISKESYKLMDDGVIITEKFATANSYDTGDKITLMIDDKEAIFTISHITENYMSDYIYVSPKLYKDITGEGAEYNTIYIKTYAKDTLETQKTGEELLKSDAVISVMYLDSIKEQVNDMLKSLDMVIYVLIISAGMLAVVVLYNLNNININERRRELASIKVLGFFNSELAAYVYRENIILTLIGSVVGVFLGKLLHRFVIVTVEIDSCMFGRNVYPLSYVYSVLFTILFALIVNGVMYFKLKKIDMVESLKSVE